MDSLREEGISVPVSGCDFVPTDFSNLTLTEPGGKCIHGNYIPSNQEDQSFSEFCGVCTSLRAFCKYHNITYTQESIRTYILLNYEGDEQKELLEALKEGDTWQILEQRLQLPWFMKAGFRKTLETQAIGQKDS